MHACTDIVLARARAKLHVYVHITPHVHFGSIVGASNVRDNSELSLSRAADRNINNLFVRFIK